MIEAAARVPRGTAVAADVCIIGAGAAGIPLALALSGKGLSVVLLEAGRGPNDGAAQSLYDGDLARPGPHAPPATGRSRGLGGSTQHWDGSCMPLDPIDFERRAHVPGSGWPISWDGLRPWWAQAARWLEAGRLDTPSPMGPLLDGLQDSVVDASVVERLSCPTDMGHRYRPRLQAAGDVRVLTGAHATAIRLQPDGRRVRNVECATLAGHRFRVEARATVIAAGGLETPRLLLHSRDVQPQGIGNAADQVGRYYQCQLRGPVATFMPQRGTPRSDWGLAPDGVPCRPRLALTPAVQRAQGLLQASFWLAEPAPDVDTAAPLRQHLRALRAGWQSALRRITQGRRWPVEQAGLALWVQAEQQPLPSSRVLLGDTCDALGMPRLRVDWRHGQADARSVHRTLALLGEALQRAGCGRLEIDDDALEAGALAPVRGHHIGTARMGRDPRSSVVDADGRVHGVQDLWIAGSAVFPTCGHAGPTLTIVALALRLAHHLVARLQPRRAAALELFA